MRRRHRSLRELLADLRRSAEERDDACCEECLEPLFDPERHATLPLLEREEAALEAQRRRWASGQGAR